MSDLLGWPEYEVNAPFDTPYNISLHPTVPEKEPPELMEMQTHIQKMGNTVRPSYRFIEAEGMNSVKAP